MSETPHLPPDSPPPAQPAPSASGRTSKVPFIAALVLVIGAVAGVGGYLVAAGNDGEDGDDGVADNVGEDGAAGDDSEDGSPEEAVRAYLRAAVESDCERLVDLTSEDLTLQLTDSDEMPSRQEAVDDCRETEEDSAGEDISDQDLEVMLDSVELTGEERDQATVTYTQVSPDSATLEVQLVREDGAWKIDDMVPTAGDPREGSPEAAALDYAEALIAQDCDAYLAATTEDSGETLGGTPSEQLAGCEQLLTENPPGMPDRQPPDLLVGPISVESQDDDVARVWVNIFEEDFGADHADDPDYEPVNRSLPLTVVKEDGAWKVDPYAPDWSAEG